MDERELVGLLYRADWTKLALSGTVQAEEHGDDSFAVNQHIGFSGARWAPKFGGETQLTIGPGGRYRHTTANGARIRGYDASRTWEWFREKPPGARINVSGRPRVPAPTLLTPYWLLAGHQLTVEGRKSVLGRNGFRVIAKPVQRRRSAGHPGEDWLRETAPEQHYTRALVVVDAELGILLRCVYEDARGTALGVAKFVRLAVGAAAVGTAAADFAPPAGSIPGRAESDFARTVFGPGGEVGWQAAKAAGGLAAAGLGAAMRLTPARAPEPFEQAVSEEPDDAMPATDLLPDAVASAAEGDAPPDLPPVSDEVLNLLHRGSIPPAPFSATLHEWIDAAATMAAVPESARRTGFGGVGFLIDAVQEKIAARGGGTLHRVHQVRFGDGTRYRVDRVRPDPAAAERRRQGMAPRTVAADGRQSWKVYAEKVETRPISRTHAPSEIAAMADGSWLLGHQLFDGSPTEVDGRAGYRVVAIRRRRPGWLTVLAGNWLPAVAVVDAETGRLLRLTRYKSGRATTVLELRSVGPAGTDGFEFAPPPGLPVTDPVEEYRKKQQEEFLAQQRTGTPGAP